MLRHLRLVVACALVLPLACGESPEAPAPLAGESDGGGSLVDAAGPRGDGSAPEPESDASTEHPGLIWPNSESSTNGDAWLRQHHDEVSELRPRVLLLLANNKDTPKNAEDFANKTIAAYREASRFRGYKDPKAWAQLAYEIFKVADMRDSSGMDWPAAWPTTGSGNTLSFVYEGLFKPAFAVHFGVKDPKDATRYLPLCELFERGLINELWIAAPRVNGNPLGVYESKARVQSYDEDLAPVAGKFDACAANGCYDPGLAGQCKVTVRLMELATDRGTGCALHATGHGMEGLRRAIPYYAAASARFFNFDMKARYGLPIDSPYDTCNYSAAACWRFPNDHTLTKSPAGGSTAASFTFDRWGEGCGNVHFPPNGSQQYAYSEATPVRSTCEHYGLGGGAAGKDLATPFTSQLVSDYEKRFGDCGGGWQVYMRQSMPGYGNGGVGDDGKPLKSWWPFLYW
jgi:hypothetical protein